MANGIFGRRGEHVFFCSLALLLLAYVLLGFWPSYFSTGLVLAPLPGWLVHVHAFLFVGWITLFGVQAGLIAAGRVARHRNLGMIMGWWAVAMVLIGPATVVMAVRRPHSGLGAAVLAGDLAQTIAFGTLVSMGLARRRSAADHKRLMLLASASIVGPALARWPFEFIQNGPPFGLAAFYLLPALLLLAYDLVGLRRVHRATWLGLGVMLLVLASFLVLPAWQGWLAFTDWVKQI